MKKLFSKSSGIALSLAAVAGLLLTGCNKEETVLLPGDAGVITQTTQDDGSVLLSVDEIANAETYNWYKDGASVQNTDSRTYLALESGVYKVAGVNANGEGKPSGEVDVEVALVEPEPEEFNILTKEYIPDDAFREYIKTEIAGKDEYTNIEAASYDGSIILTKSEISDLTGIGYFTSLPVLSFTDNAALQYLDLSANKALEVIEKFISKNPRIWHGYFIKGWALRKLKRYAEAEEALLKCISCGESNADIYNELSICALEKGNRELAKSYLDAAVDLDGENLTLASNLAFLHLMDEDYDQAKEWIEKCRILAPEDRQVQSMMKEYTEKTGEEFGPVIREEYVHDPEGKEKDHEHHHHHHEHGEHCTHDHDEDAEEDEEE